MAQIVINEVSQNYSYNIGNNSFATVALPITACWGPGYFEPDTQDVDHQEMLEYTAWQRFPANQTGLESFVSTYRGPATNYRLTQDYSYQMAMTLMTAGYDVLVCRLSPGAKAGGQMKTKDGNSTVYFTAKYPGTFGNSLRVEIKKFSYKKRENGKYVNGYYWNLITSIIDDSGIKTSVENKTMVFDIENATDTILHYSEIDSNFIDIAVDGVISDDENTEFKSVDAAGVDIPDDKLLSALPYSDLVGGTDKAANPQDPDLLAAYQAAAEQYEKLHDKNDHNADLEIAVDNAVAAFNQAVSTYNTDKDAYETATGETFDTSQTVEAAQAAYDAAEAEAEADPSDEAKAKAAADALLNLTAVQSYSAMTEAQTAKAEAEAALEAAKGSTGTAYVAMAEAKAALDTDTYEGLLDDALAMAKLRYGFKSDGDDPDKIEDFPYLRTLSGIDTVDVVKASNIRYLEWLYTNAVGYKNADGQVEGVYDLLKDKLTYNPNRIISPGWDDQNIKYITDTDDLVDLNQISPLTLKIMDVAYYSRCATGMIDIPRSLKRAEVYNDDIDPLEEGYVQKVARYIPDDTTGDVNGSLYQSHSAIFGPWGKYTYVGTSKQAIASPSFLALMIQRAQILNQANQFEWALPTNRKHNLRIGKMDYNVPKKLLDVWQTLEGVGVNVITNIPDLGTNIWGNSTLFEVPPATYQALANLSTRYLVNAVEDVVYRVGIGITFSYNNDQAYNKFYAGVTPILDTMKNVGAIDDYYVRMSADINGLDHVNANTVIGKIYLVVNGVINDIIVDLVALPPGVDLNQFRG